jgi:hypothetical protein
VTEDVNYVCPENFLLPGSRDMWDANNKVIDYLYRALCASEFNRVYGEALVCKIWEKLQNAHGGNSQVKARMFATYRREYENFTHLPASRLMSCSSALYVL